MSLVLTELSNHGVAMAADAAVTCPSGRVFVGAQKLLPVRILNAGVSVWGLGRVSATDADIWLE